MGTGHTEVTDQAGTAAHDGPCDGEHCGLKEVLERLGDRWSLLILVELDKGPRRFRELQRAIPNISQRMLTLTTRHLLRDDLISRTVFATSPPQVEYALTDIGHELAVAVEPVVGWARLHHDRIRSSRAAFDAARGESASPTAESDRSHRAGPRRPGDAESDRRHLRH